MCYPKMLANYPELIEENIIMFFCDGTTKGVGEVVNLIL